MLSFTPTEEQQLLLDTLKRYAADQVRPAAHDADEGGAFPREIVETGLAMGLIPTALPEEMGGLGEMSALTGVLAAEALAWGDLSLALQVMQPALFAYPVALYGTAEQREHWLPPFLEEHPMPATAALLEPGILFDAANLKTTATADGDRVRLNGAKAYVPGAADAPIMLVYARSSETGALEAYLVARETPGVTVAEREKLMGVRALSTYRVHLNDAAVPAACRLGGAVGSDTTRLLDRSRVALAAMAVGVADAAAAYARDYAKQRVAFGVPIAQKQAIAFMLAEMAIEVDAARLMTWEAAWLIDSDADADAITRAAALAKGYADKAALFVTDGAVQVLGGYGFIREYPAERWLRNARGFTTFDGLAIV
jgi:alkylation response protein AidB-like acyl-CoA dehydrogenase